MMKTKLILFLLLLIPITISALVKQQSKQHAPLDAFSEDSSYAYYGSASEWGRQMFSASSVESSYKRRGQRQLLAILDGKPQEAITMCQEYLMKDPNDTEQFFMLTLAWLALDDLAKAQEYMQQAVNKGMPFERFLAGPRQLLKPLTKSELFQKLYKVFQNQLIHGPMLGSMTDKSVRFWLRTFDEVPVALKIFSDQDNFEPILTDPVYTRSDQDYTAIVEIKNLQANQIYSYDILINGKPVVRSPYASFKTFPEVGKGSHFRVAFGGGAGYTPKYEYMWETIISREPEALLFLGDNVYIDLPEMPGAFHDYTYYRRQSRPEYRLLIQSIPVFAIWDDHDSAINDVWLGPYIDKPRWKLPLLNVFKMNWNNPGYGIDSCPGCWFKFTIADVDFFMLDCRFYRTNPLLETTSMLGSLQKEWLFHELTKSTATFKVLVSSVPWAQNTKPGSLDTWDGYAGEREEIFTYIEKERINGIFLLSADRHRSDIWKIERKNGYDLYEFER